MPLAIEFINLLAGVGGGWRPREADAVGRRMGLATIKCQTYLPSRTHCCLAPSSVRPLPPCHVGTGTPSSARAAANRVLTVPGRDASGALAYRLLSAQHPNMEVTKLGRSSGAQLAIGL